MPTFQIKLAGVDITDLLIDDPMEIQASSEVPHFSDTEMSDITFRVYSQDSDFDPLKANNFFERHWDRKEPQRFNRTGYKAPVEIISDGSAIFVGHVIDVVHDPTTDSATLHASDLSRDLRESDLSLEPFGLQRYVLAPVGEDVSGLHVDYPLPPSAAPVFPKSVAARLGSRDLTRVNILKTEGVNADTDFVVNGGVPEIRTPEALPQMPAVKFREPYRWVRVETLVKRILESVDNTLEADIDVPNWTTPAREFATRGRVGWHIEGGESYQSAMNWGYTGYVRDFVVNPENNDAFFLYGSSEYTNSIIHYDYEEDTYTQHRFSLSGVTGIQSLWRIATPNYEHFYVLGTKEEGFTERGHNYHSGSSQPGKPVVYKFVLSTKTWSVFDDTNSPQLANYIHTSNDTGGGVNRWYGDTGRLFHAWRDDDSGRNYLAYIIQQQRQTDSGIRVLRLSESSGEVQSYLFAAHQPIHSRTGLGSNYAIDQTSRRIFRVSVDNTGVLHLYRTPVGITGVFSELRTETADPDYLDVSHLVAHTTGGVTTVYGVLQFKRPMRGLAGSALVRFRSNNAWAMETLKEYNYNFFGARGGVVHNDEIYYFEGSRYQYEYQGGDMLPRRAETPPGQLIEVSSGTIKNHGRVWQSKIIPGDTHGEVFGVHDAIIAPMRSDGERLHLLAGYGNVPRSIENPPTLYTDKTGKRDLSADTHSDDIANWQWVTYGRSQPLYLERFEVSERQKAWEALRELAAVSYSHIGFKHEVVDGITVSRFYFRPRPGVQTHPLVRTFDNYSVDESLVSVDVKPTYSQLYNQIRGSVTYTIKDLIPDALDVRELLAENSDSITFNGVKPLSIDMSRLTHHQLWWAGILADRYLKEVSTLNSDVRVLADWSPSLAIGDVVAFDVRRPPFKDIHKTSLEDTRRAYIVQLIHNVSADGDTAWTTQIVARTFTQQDVTPADTTAPQIETVRPPTLSTDEPEAEGRRGPWSGFGLTWDSSTSQVVVLDNVANQAYAYLYPSRDQDISIDLGTGDWRDASGAGATYYFLDAATPALRAYTRSSDFTAITPQTASNIDLPAGDWVAVATTDTTAYVLNKSDAKVYVFRLSDGQRLSRQEIPLRLRANWKSMAVSDGQLHLLVGDAGITIAYDLSTKNRVDGNVKTYIQGAVDWVGLESSDATDRSGLYVLRQDSTRILAYTPGRDSEKDFRL